MRWAVTLLGIALAGSCTKDTNSAQNTNSQQPAITTTATTPTTTSEDEPFDAQLVVVTGVTDGDTLDVEIGGTADTVRLIGINSPESGECLADAAKNRLADLVDGHTVRLEADTSDRDQYDRLLRYIWIDDLLINEQLVLDGLAIARRYPPDTAHADLFDAAQESAQGAASGIWDPEACGPGASNTDSSPHQLSVGHIEADAPGDDSQNLNGEWIEIRNEADAPIDLAGWTLRDESATHRYEFPPITLNAGGTVTIYSGCGDDTQTSLYWCATRSAIWNNAGDTAFLIDPVGNTATSFGY